MRSSRIARGRAGYLQIYYSNGGGCHFQDHFLSLHSFVGIVVLAVFWTQAALGGLIFSNKAFASVRLKR